uniref:Katanin regulatory subunit B1 like 1 n=1 Tax=Anas platyrhynchos platyrhynchos TaxID=8840 RepID=A0A493U3Q0_ANAPP
MASEAHNVRKQKVLHIEGCLVDLPRKRISSSTRKIMKEGKKSPKQLASYTNRVTVGKTVTSPLSLFKVVYCKRKVRCYTPKPCYKKKQFPKSRGCDMANKENELACAGNLPAKLHDSRTHLLNSSDSGSSQTEGPSSKYSGFFSEVSQDHETMAQVLFSRNLRLNVALTFWRRRSISELVAYLVRIQDLGVVVDCLPVLTNSLQEEKPYISIGCCVDLLPLVKSLLKSKYEEYVIVGLNWLQAVIKRWWSELSSHTERADDRNIHILKELLSGLWEQENHLTLVPGYTGNIAKVTGASDNMRSSKVFAGLVLRKW